MKKWALIVSFICLLAIGFFSSVESNGSIVAVDDGAGPMAKPSSIYTVA